MTKRILGALALASIAAASLAACSSVPGASRVAKFKWPGSRASLEKVANPCIDFTVSVYFPANVSSLSRENRAVLANATGLARGCKVDSVNVVGLTDPTGTSEANLALSRRRAEAVRQALISGGLPNVNFDGAGAQGAVRSDGAVDPLRRRADVLISLSPL